MPPDVVERIFGERLVLTSYFQEYKSKWDEKMLNNEKLRKSIQADKNANLNSFLKGLMGEEFESGEKEKKEVHSMKLSDLLAPS